MFSISRSFLACAAMLMCLEQAAHAGIDTDSVRLAATGQFSALEQLMEGQEAKGKGVLGTRDRHALCFAYSKTKRYDRLNRCLDLLEQQVAQGDRRTRLFGLDDATPSIELMRAEALLELGQYPQAVARARKVIEWIASEGSDDRDFELQAMAVMVIALVHSAERVQARQELKKLDAMSTAFPLFDDYAPVRVFTLARSHAALGEYDRAIELLEGDQYFKLRRFLDNLFSGAALQGLNYWMWADLPRGYLLARSRLEVGRKNEAREDLDRLLAIPAAQANGEVYWQMLYDRGRIAQEEGQPQQAAEFYRRAIDIIERQRTSIQTEINKIGFVTDKQAVYGRLIDVSLRAGQASAALEIVERSKSRALVDLLAAKNNFGSAEDAPRLAALSQAETQLRLQGATDSNQHQLSRTRWVDARDSLQQTQPELGSLVTVTQVSLAQIQQRLQPGEVLVEYYLTDEALIAFVADGQKIQAYPLEVRGLQADIQALRKAIINPDDHGTTQRLGLALHARLLAPLQERIAGKNLLLVPHGSLHYLPFSMLHDGRQPLIQQARLRVLPSSSVLLYLGQRERSESTAASLLILGNPDLGDAQLDLPSAEAEARRIAKLHRSSHLLVRDQASETAFKELAPGYRYVHVASHGQFNSTNPLGSRLLLRKTAKDDGSLTVNELYDLRLKAELVVLSACETGLGGLMGGDDVVGLNRAFLYSGAQSIVGSLWEVDDDSTAVLMEYFYRAILEGKDKAAALQLAQNQLRQEQPHPYHWAAFYLTGLGR